MLTLTLFVLAGTVLTAAIPRSQQPFKCIHHYLKSLGHNHVLHSLHSDYLAARAIEHTLQQRKKNDNTSAPYTICVDYHLSSTLIDTYDQFQFSPTYSSSTENLACFQVVLSNPEFESTGQGRVPLLLFQPIPDALKMDSSIHKYMAALGSHSERRRLSLEAAGHPILSAIIEESSVGLSVMFVGDRSRSSRSHSEEVHRARFQAWVESLRMTDSGHIDKVVGSVFWLASEGLAPKSKVGFLFRAAHGTGSSMAVLRQAETAARDTAEFNARREQWVAWRAELRRLASSKAGNVYESCAFDQMGASYRQDSLYITLPVSLLSVSGSEQQMATAAACFSLLVSSIAADPVVSRLTLSRPMRTLNNNARQIVQSGYRSGVEPFSKAGLDGTGMVVGVSDTGIDENSCFFRDPVLGKVPRSDVESTVIDHRFRKVVQYVNFSSSGGDYRSGHGTHVAGTLAGYCSTEGSAQVNDVKNVHRGMASGAKIAFFDIGVNDREQNLVLPYELADFLYPPAYAAGARVHSNSWGGGYMYDGYCIETDRYLYQHDDFLVVFAAGNDGGKYETIVSPSLSKNALAVGCSENAQMNSPNIGNVASFSSIGPTHDGRYKPDIVAPGFSVTSANAADENSPHDTCSTIAKSGTSMATPVAAGNAVLVRQYFEDARFWAARCDLQYDLCRRGPLSLSGYLLKALILQSGAPMTKYNAPRTSVGTVPLGLAPDSFQGYGRMDLSAILFLDERPTDERPGQRNLFVDQAELLEMTELTYSVLIVNSSVPLKATISWFDPPNEVFAAKVLLHDLDLLLVDPAGSTFYGNSHSDGGLPMFGSHRDEVNTNEQVLVSRPVAGVWTVRVQAKRLTEAPSQKFGLVVTCGGRVTPVAEAVALSPLLLQACQNTGGRPFAEPRLEVELSLWARVLSLGWNVKDFYSVRSLLPSGGEGEELARGTFANHQPYEVVSTCLPAGEYEASLLLDATSLRGTQMGIAECGVYLGPLAPVRKFSISPPRSVGASGEAMAFAKDSCSLPCWANDHFVLPLLMGEEEGAGWSGTYYAVERVSDGPQSLGFAQSAMAAGTMEWGFEAVDSQCLPVSDACYALQLSVPSDTEEFPQMYVLGSFADSSAAADCRHLLDKDVTLAKFCTSAATTDSDFVSLSFYTQSQAVRTGSFGQTPLTWSAFLDAQSERNVRKVGECQLHLPRAEPATAVPTVSPVPTVAPSFFPTFRDAPTALPSLPSRPSRSPTAIPTTVQSSVPSQLFASHRFSCFSDCAGFPGKDLFGASATDTCVFLAGVYNQCDSYSVAFGLCPIVRCARDCDVNDWCYFAAGSVTSCPFEQWSGHTSAAHEIHSQCVQSVAANRKNGVGDGDDDAVAGFHLSSETRTVIIVGSIFVALLVVYALFQFLAKRRGEEAPRLSDADGSIHGTPHDLKQSERASADNGRISGFSEADDDEPVEKKRGGSLFLRSGGSAILSKFFHKVLVRTRRGSRVPRDKSSSGLRGGGGKQSYEMVSIDGSTHGGVTTDNATYAPFGITGDEDDDEDQRYAQMEEQQGSGSDRDATRL